VKNAIADVSQRTQTSKQYLNIGSINAKENAALTIMSLTYRNLLCAAERCCLMLDRIYNVKVTISVFTTIVTYISADMKLLIIYSPLIKPSFPGTCLHTSSCIRDKLHKENFAISTREINF
jgi:hypothetical protein